jgi:hypothetical protein
MEDFVTYKLAKKLKENGYPQHWSDYDYIVENEYDDNFEVGSRYDRCFIPEHLPTISAPTIYQVLKWLREEKKLHVHPEPAYFSKVGLWEVYIVNINDYVQCSTNKEYDSYEDAALDGIEYVLDNLI